MREVVVLVVLFVTIPSVYGAVTPNYMMYELRYSSNTVSWGTAWATCQEHSSSDLVDIKDSVRNKALRHFFSTPEASAMRGPMWTGLHYVKSVTGGEFQWSDCQSVNESVPWLTGQPSDQEVSSCVTAGRIQFMTRTHICSSDFVFVCQRINGDCSYTDFKDKICDTRERRVILEGQLSRSECRDRCSMEKNGSDLCWAFERDKTSSNCTLIFSPSPYVCESQVPRDDTETAARNCFEFSDITGKKETVVESNAPVSACVSTVTATTTATTAVTTTEPSTTTSITTPTTTEADSTQSTTSSTGGVESTHTEASVVTTMTTTSESPAVATVATSATTTTPSTATTTASDTDKPASTPVSSTISTAAFSSNATRGAFSPALDTFLSRLEAALTSPRSASTPTVTSLVGMSTRGVWRCRSSPLKKERSEQTTLLLTSPWTRRTSPRIGGRSPALKTNARLPRAWEEE